MRLMTAIKFTASFFLLLVSLTVYGESIEADMESKLQGEWQSPKWNYGFRIEGVSGYVTQWNYQYNPEDKTRVGDLVLTIEKYTATGFIGKQQFFNGKLVPVVVSLVEPNTIKLEAGPEVWLMVRSQ